MRTKLFWVSVAMILTFLFRERLLALLPWQQDGFSLPAVLVALVGGILAYTIAYNMVTAMRLRAVWQVASLIVFSGYIAHFLGHWLGGLPLFGEYWGGFICGVLEAAVLWGALYGAKEVWTGNQDQGPASPS